jgi:hypothetical protein
MTSPVAGLRGALLQKMSGTSEFAPFFSDQQRANIVRSLFIGYDADVKPGTVIFDTNRSWTGKLSLLSTLFPGYRIVCCVRELGWIIDSIECLVRKNWVSLYLSMTLTTSITMSQTMICNWECRSCTKFDRKSNLLNGRVACPPI